MDVALMCVAEFINQCTCLAVPLMVPTIRVLSEVEILHICVIYAPTINTRFWKKNHKTPNYVPLKQIDVFLRKTN